MKIPPEIFDTHFGKLSLVDKSAFFAEVPWNRGLNIQLFVHFSDKDHQPCFERAWEVFSAVRKHEMEFLLKGVAETGGDECMDEFLHNEWMERSIEITPSGEGQLVYFLFMLGTLVVEFSHDAAYRRAWVISC